MTVPDVTHHAEGIAVGDQPGCYPAGVLACSGNCRHCGNIVVRF